MRSGRALPLGIVAFAVFNALHAANRSGKWHGGPKRLTRDQIYQIVYAGVADPPQPVTLTQIIWQLNRQVAYLGLTIKSYGKGPRSAWVLEALS